MNKYPTICVVNASTVLTDAEVKNACKAFNDAVWLDFRPYWGNVAHVGFYPTSGPFPSGGIICHIQDNLDVQGALGYHDVDGNDLPVMYIGAGIDLQYGYSWQVTVMHEIFELLADPHIERVNVVSSSEAIALEVGDPVEGDQFAYTRKGADGVTDIKISDFITEFWFKPGDPGPYDFTGHVSKPLEVLAGGYISIMKPGTSGKFVWTQYQQQKGELVPVRTSDPDDEPHIAHAPQDEGALHRVRDRTQTREEDR